MIPNHGVVMNRPWFAAKKNGYGVGRPMTWEGRLTIMGAIGTIAFSNLIMIWAKNISVMIMFCVVDMIIVIGLLWICSIKTEGGWKWRWSGK